MTDYRLIVALLAAALAGACTEEHSQPRMTFGPPTYLPHMAPTMGMGSADEDSGWRATEGNFRPATPGAFRGF
jgi:hypothetical protein